MNDLEKRVIHVRSARKLNLLELTLVFDRKKVGSILIAIASRRRSFSKFGLLCCSGVRFFVHVFKIAIALSLFPCFIELSQLQVDHRKGILPCKKKKVIVN